VCIRKSSLSIDCALCSERALKEVAATCRSVSGRVSAALLPATLVDQGNRESARNGILDEPFAVSVQSNNDDLVMSRLGSLARLIRRADE
jgi:hypothetical protein